MKCIVLSEVPVDGLVVQMRPNFLVYCVELLARQRWEEISSISMMTRVSHPLWREFPSNKISASPSLLEIRLAIIW